MSAPPSKVHHVFPRPEHFDNELLKKSWMLRSQFPKNPYPIEVIKSRPPFIRASFATTPQASAIVRHYFPGLEPRDGYKDGIFGVSPARHILHIYELEGYLQKEWSPRVLHMICGMNHFTQYLQDVVYVVQTPVRVSSNNTESIKFIKTTAAHLDKKRLVIFLVVDEDRDQYCLSWYDQKYGSIFFIDSHPDGYKSLKTVQVEQTEVIIREYLKRGGCAEPAEGITAVKSTPRTSPNESGLFVLNNLRMRLLESDEVLNRRNVAGYVDWVYSFLFTGNLVPQHGVKEDTMRDMMITALKIELGSQYRPLRWPEQPAVHDDKWQGYAVADDTQPTGAIYKANSTFLPTGSDIPEISQEDHNDQMARMTRSASVMAAHMFTMSRAPSTILGGSTQRGTPSPPASIRSQHSRQSKRSKHDQVPSMPAIEELSMQDFGGGDDEQMTPTELRFRKAPGGTIPGPRSHISQSHSRRASSSLGRAASNMDDPFASPRGAQSEQPAPRSRQSSHAGTRSRQVSASEAGSQSSRPSPLQRPEAIAPPRRGVEQEELPVQPRPRRQMSDRHRLPYQRTYNLRGNVAREDTPPPDNPNYQYVWWEKGVNVGQPNVDDEFMGWEYEMSLERWNVKHGQNE